MHVEQQQKDFIREKLGSGCAYIVFGICLLGVVATDIYFRKSRTAKLTTKKEVIAQKG